MLSLQEIRQKVGKKVDTRDRRKEDNLFALLVQRIDPQGKLLRTWELQGGVSAQVTAFEIEYAGGQTKKLLVRRHGAVDLAHNPQIAAAEFRLLQLLRSAGLAVPTPYYCDPSGEIFATPSLVIEYIEGSTEFAPADLSDLLLQLATQLARIHALDCSQWDLSFLPQQDKIYARTLSARPAKIDESLDEGHIRAVLEAAGPLSQHNPDRLLHGDFWPGNVLWRDGRLVAVIDWEDARLGDPLADLANSRLELLWASGIDAMYSFTDRYRSMTALDFTNLPYWDLYAALRPAFKIAEWAADAHAEKIMRERHRLFINQAFETLASGRAYLD